MPIWLRSRKKHFLVLSPVGVKENLLVFQMEWTQVELALMAWSH